MWILCHFKANNFAIKPLWGPKFQISEFWVFGVQFAPQFCQVWKCKTRLLFGISVPCDFLCVVNRKRDSVELWNMAHFLNFSDVVIAWCFWVFDVAEKLCHLFYISLWSGSSYAASWYATPLLWQCQLWSQCDTAAALRIILILLVYLLRLMSFELTWSILKWRLGGIFPQTSGCSKYSEFTLSIAMAAFYIGAFLHEMEINNQVNDYELCSLHH